MSNGEAAGNTGLVSHGGKFDVDGAVPPPEQWALVLDDAMKATAVCDAGLPGVGRGKKIHKMQFCLAEARRRRTMKHLGSALCIAIMQDKRETRMLIRYKAVGKDLEIHTGIICHKRDVPDIHNFGADALRRGSIKGIEHCCTALAAPMSTKSKAVFDKELFSDILSKVECFTADGAADEQRAGRELASGLLLRGVDVERLRGTLAQDLPALKVYGNPLHAEASYAPASLLA
jgi:hypothetical protein